MAAVVVLLASVVAGVAYMFGRASGPSYTYLHQGGVQFRVDARSGRTDRLEASGWQPFSFERPPEALPGSVVNLGNGTWESSFTSPPGRICFDAQNNSDFVIQDVRVAVSFDPKPADYPSANGTNSGDPLDLILGSEYSLLKTETGHLLGARENV